jgi:hypothetical protein
VLADLYPLEAPLSSLALVLVLAHGAGSWRRRIGLQSCAVDAHARAMWDGRVCGLDDTGERGDRGVARLALHVPDVEPLRDTAALDMPLPG